MNRRELLLGLAAGGAVVAGELWIPGQRLISIPAKKVWTHVEYVHNIIVKPELMAKEATRILLQLMEKSRRQQLADLRNGLYGPYRAIV